MFGFRLVLQTPGRLPAVELRKIQIHHDEVRKQRFRPFDALRAVRCNRDLESDASQPSLQHEQVLRIVFDTKNPRHRTSPISGAPTAARLRAAIRRDRMPVSAWSVAPRRRAGGTAYRGSCHHPPPAGASPFEIAFTAKRCSRMEVIIKSRTSPINSS